MKPSFVELRCPNEPAADKRMQCRRNLFGPAPETISAHDFDKAPFVDYRFCGSCGILYRITIATIDDTPSIEALADGTHLTGIAIEDHFGAARVTGGIPRHKAGAA